MRELSEEVLIGVGSLLFQYLGDVDEQPSGEGGTYVWAVGHDGPIHFDNELLS